MKFHIFSKLENLSHVEDQPCNWYDQRGYPFFTSHAGSDEKKPKEIISIIEDHYDTHIAGSTKSFAEFFQAVCKTIE